MNYVELIEEKLKRSGREAIVRCEEVYEGSYVVSIGDDTHLVTLEMWKNSDSYDSNLVNFGEYLSSLVVRKYIAKLLIGEIFKKRESNK